MAITVEMIEQKNFKTKVRGYDPVEVDEFLDEICDEMVALQDRIDTLQNQVSQARTAAAPAAMPVAAPIMQRPVPAPAPANTMSEDQQETVRKLLLSAQRVSDDTVADAHNRAETILAEAQEKADKMLANLSADKTNLTNEVEALKKTADDYRASIRKLIADTQRAIENK